MASQAHRQHITSRALSAGHQFASLASAFDLRSLTLTPNNFSTFPQLVSIVKAYLEEQLQGCPAERPVYLFGESFGALIALAVALETTHLVDRLLLVNPATSYQDSWLSRAGPLLALMPTQVYQALPGVMMGGPLRLASTLIRRPAATSGQEAQQSLVEYIQGLACTLPARTLNWRLSVLWEGVRAVEPRLSEVAQRTMILAASKDLLLPNEAEARRLLLKLQRSFFCVLRGHGHAVLQERNIHLLHIMKQEGFYVAQRTFTAQLRAGDPGITNAGTAEPLEMPTKEEVVRVARFVNGPIRALVSPVFLSTLEDGRVVEGMAGVPHVRPLLIVGNHQLFAPDLNILVEELFLQHHTLVRGLAHPAIFRDKAANEGVSFLDPQAFKNVYTTYGGVPVTPKNCFRLFQNKEAILLFPGGVREAFKRKGEMYELFWPDRPEFVRMAARFGATIMPLASVGAEDSLDILLDTEELKTHNWFQGFKEDAQRMPDVSHRKRSVAESMDQTFIPPVLAPRMPSRFYYLFRKPILTSPADYNDREKCDDIYRHVKEEVEKGIAYLLRKRGMDPYRDFLPRMMYEHPVGRAARKAPSFTP
ncbi:hypothetical protein WJX72_003591 [[Myrmecia] bisecta]|uniref:Serine aminopeptidase S33 domain-containing protein n=1 Tax=[Myrmecia] bisecta TaxID=41462 RepID=A0AAW1P9E1_9CHLO